MSLSLRQLRYAIAVSETRHFGRAAERCHVSQPALSQQIALLEQACGTTLFDRLKKAVSPTPFGREFIDRARAIVEAADALEAFAAGHAGIPTRPLRFGLIPTVAPYLLPDIFPALQRHLPHLEFTVSESRTASLVDGLGDGGLDLALIATEPGPGGPRLTVEPLFEDNFVLATGKATAPEPVRLDAIDKSQLLLLDEGHCLRDQALAACRLTGETTARTFAATSLSTIVEFVANGQGITLLPEIALRKEATDRRIHIRPLASPGAGRRLNLVWREATPFAATYRQIAQCIREAHRT